ncbi:Transcription initiation factor TFIID subunit 9 [Friedmanniomyces endolithicus]|uniref:Transcription initiation factor TFIID subunit 9 n=1 Tax=Friedmanniomyces endolithicus TaxID=329885 RepID=A0AAN6KBQ3_9PEZI|nr:Transcription initiation factor TFIID subunit 9 [Friedmanniomyces endolithicus]KAK0274843.1 Transcription initiation factor TFIID subunit 9 [Friedmanniomyces endolithicus]KAK0306990.1 Transcription initiation factor TFIID subunit 9 [Friedmanniomyces endolithicus]KAK0919765.1 Transcription initiation factor TFIID subunit 9 [Friedmanniomyces endolithicus]KAK0969766.1 Transcription initiation factor TFIID subunit 9 [Friedmanniomyces endolithicus]
MASPLANGTHPSTPPPSDTAPPAMRRDATTAQPDLDIPRTSSQDDGQSKRPRDARIIHLVLASLGINSYQERVPLQLLDFAYRYTSGVLSDSLRLSAEGYAGQPERGAGRGRGAGAAGAGDVGAGEGITVTSLRQAIASRQGYTFQGHLPKEFMLEQAAERNRVALPKVERSYGVQLPPEKYCLTGVGWNLKDEWDSDEDLEDDEDEGMEGVGAQPKPLTNGTAHAATEDDVGMGGVEGEDEEGEGRMEDVFGEEGGEDTEMA